MSQIITERKLVKCRSCKYEWATASKLYYVTCPRCRNNIKIVDFASKKRESKRSLEI